MQQILNFHEIKAPNSEYKSRTFKDLKVINSGIEGEVVKATPSGCNLTYDVALKIHNKNARITNQYKNFLQELKEKPLPQIINIYDFFDTDKGFVLVMELGDQDLKTYLTNNPKLSMMEKNKIAQQILESIYYLHKKQIVHRDLKPTNFILVNGKVKLIDFGLVCNQQTDNISTDITGAIQYQSPECIDQCTYDTSSDIWSLGCILYEIYTGGQLVSRKTNKMQLDKAFNDVTIQLSDNLKQKINQMLNKEPKMRPQIKEVIDALIENNIMYDNHFSILFNYMSNLDQWVEDLKFESKNYLTPVQLQPFSQFNKFIQAIKSQTTQSQIFQPKQFNTNSFINFQKK